MKPQERNLLQAIAGSPSDETPRSVIARQLLYHKTALAYLVKWHKKGWYAWRDPDNIDLGWLTVEGIMAADA